MPLSSMTGFARSHGASGPYAFEWELKSVNAKGFDLRMRLPPGWDELEALGDQFNDMAGRLQESYADLEHKVEDRTRELAQSVEELRALGERRFCSQLIPCQSDETDHRQRHSTCSRRCQDRDPG